MIRELLVNAIMHRDYSPDARGAQVQVELYSDRFVIRSPGGLYGPITEADLGAEDLTSTTRNQVLAALLADVEVPGSLGETLCENRGSGLLSVRSELRRAGMEPMEFDVRPGRVTATVRRLPDRAYGGPARSDDLDPGALATVEVIQAGARTSRAIADALGVSPKTATRRVARLIDAGVVEATAPPRSKLQSYRIVEP